MPANSRAYSYSSTKYLGVSRRGNKFQAQIYHNGENMYIGSFETIEEAARMYNQRAKAYGKTKINKLPDDTPGDAARKPTSSTSKKSSGQKRGRGGGSGATTNAAKKISKLSRTKSISLKKESGTIGDSGLSSSSGRKKAGRANKRFKKPVKTKYIGVRQVGPRRFSAQLSHRGGTKMLGVYSTAKAAARIYNKAAIKLGRTNINHFPSDSRNAKKRQSGREDELIEDDDDDDDDEEEDEHEERNGGRSTGGPEYLLIDDDDDVDGGGGRGDNGGDKRNRSNGRENDDREEEVGEKAIAKRRSTATGTTAAAAANGSSGSSSKRSAPLPWSRYKPTIKKLEREFHRQIGQEAWERVGHVLEKEHIGIDVIHVCSEAEFKEIGLRIGDRKRILKAVKIMTEKGLII
mmetsp:Transcript_17201/g.27934  ORF Transcript_17201/g.27934 Transcript_17201/m.27934 type:complete len:405 (+) Transcript_17201:213-1427(+)